MLGKRKPIPEHLLYEASTGVSSSAFLAAVTFFFIGLLFTVSGDAKSQLTIPFMFLFASAIGFLLSSLFYANATGDVARRNESRVTKELVVANAFSEYMGVFLLLLSLPITVHVVVDSTTLSYFVLSLVTVGLLVYHFGEYSILHNQFDRIFGSVVLVVVLALAWISLLSFIGTSQQLYELSAYVELGLLLVLTAVVALSPTEKHRF